MIQKVALHSPSKEFCPEVIDFQAGRYVLSEELVVRFYFLIRCFYKDFSMFVPEAHKRLGSADDFRHRQTAIIQCLTHLQEDYSVDNVTENLSTDSLHSPLGEREKSEILLARLNYAFNVCSPEVFREQFRGLKFLVGEQHEVAKANCQPVFVLVFHLSIFVRVFKHIVALPLKGVVFIHINIGKDLFSEEFNLFSLPEVHVTSTDKTVFPLVKAVPELVVESLERKAPSRRHPADECLFSTIVECVNDLFGDVASIKHQRVYCNIKTCSDIVYHIHYRIDVQHIARYDVIPDRKPAFFIQHEHHTCLYGGSLNAMAAKGIERIVFNVIGKRSGVNIAASSKLWVVIPHLLYESLEEGEPVSILSHHREEGRVATQRCRWNIAQYIGCKGLLHKAVTGNPAAIAQDAMEDMAKYSLQINRLRKSLLKNLHQSCLHQKAHQKVGVSENSMHFCFRKDFQGGRKPGIIPSNFIKTVSCGVVEDKASLWGKKDAGFAIVTKPHDFTEAFPNNLPGVELPSILDVSGLLDCGAAADNVAVAVPDQLLNSYECHTPMLYLIVLSSTTNIANNRESAISYYKKYTINQQISEMHLAA